MTACAAFAPLYYRAMQQALVDVTIADASAVGSSLQLSSAPGDGAYTSAPVLAPENVAASLPTAYHDDFAEPVLGYSANAKVQPQTLTSTSGDLIWRDRMCDHLTFTTGRCPDTVGEIAVSEDDARVLGYEVGRPVTIAGAAQEDGDQVLVALEVVGVYQQERDPYWFGQPLTGWAAAPLPTGEGPKHDVWLAPRATFEQGADGVAPRESSAGYLLDLDAVDVDALLALGPAVTRLAEDPPEVGEAPLRVISDLPSLASDVQDQIDQSRVTVPLLMAQLCLLAIVVLWLVLLAITEQRRPEVALARLRGRGRRGARRMLLIELLPVTLLALVPGALLAIFASWFARMALLPGEPPFELGWPFLAALAAAAVVLTGVTLVAVSRVVREPVERLLRRVPPRNAGWALGATDAVVIAGAGGIVVVFATGGLDGPIALAAPGLLAIVVGLLLAHLTTPAAARLGRRRLRRGRVRSGVSLLDAARSPATRRIVAIVTLASALAVFSADALVVGQRNRATAAEQAAGAARTAEVRGNDLLAVRSALAEVDPDGRLVTPVVRVSPPGEGAGNTLAVVPASFSEIGLFPGGAPPAELWDKLAPPDDDPIVLTGDRFSIELADSSLSSLRQDGKTHPVTVGLDLVTQQGETLHTTLGQLPKGKRAASFSQRVSCTEGCKVTGVWFSSLPGASINGKVTLRNLVPASGEVDGPVVGLGPADRWTAYADRSIGRLDPRSASADELTVEVESSSATVLTLQQNWLPTVVPTLVSGPRTTGSERNRVAMVGLDRESQTAARVGVLERAPASQAGTIVGNLDTLERGRAIAPEDRIEVWFADDGEQLYEQVSTALAEQGVEIATTRTLSEVRLSYDASAAAWSLQLAALVGAVALLIALLVLVVSAVSGWRFRTRDFAALRMSGVPMRSIRSMAVAAQFPAVLVGVVAGGLSGLFGAQLAMSIVPLFATAPEVSTLDLGTAWWAVVAAIALSLVVLGAGSVLIGRALASRAELQRLRETM
jgi:predicted lysophospholipase L1 biosynthesis ABC-type transport system permease subunit